MRSNLTRALAVCLSLHASKASAQAPVAEPSPALTAPALAGPAPAGPAPAAPLLKASLDDGFQARSSAGDFSLRLGLQSQFRAEYSNNPDRTRDATFLMRQVRPQLRATLGAPWLRLFIQPELAGTAPRLLDFEADLRPHDAFGLRVGQFMTPFSRSFYTPVPRLQFPDFSIVNDVFRADRDTGAMVSGAPLDGKLEYYAGVFDGNGINKGGNDDARLLWVGRISVAPLGAMPLDETLALGARRPARLALGVNGYIGETTHIEQRADPTTGLAKSLSLGIDESNTGGADVAFAWGRFSSLVEAYARKATYYDGKSKKSAGGFVQASVMAIDRVLEVAGRANLIDPNLDAGDDRVRSFEAMLVGYLRGNHAKLQARYTHLRNEAPAAGARATVHTVTLQTQLFF